MPNRYMCLDCGPHRVGEDDDYSRDSSRHGEFIHRKLSELASTFGIVCVCMHVCVCCTYSDSSSHDSFAYQKVQELLSMFGIFVCECVSECVSVCMYMLYIFKHICIILSHTQAPCWN
jgi:hypothetical protein